MESNYEPLKRSLLLMKYDTKMTLTENEEKILEYLNDSDKEQLNEIAPLVWGLIAAGSAIAGYFTIKNWNDIVEWFKNADTHDWLSLIEITTGVAGGILAATGVGAPLGGILLGVSTAAGLADAYVYYKEGDPYMAGIMTILAIVPGGELTKIFKKSKFITQKGLPYVRNLFKRAKSGSKLSKTEGKELVQLSEDMVEQAGPIKQSFLKNTAKKYLVNLKNMSPKWIANLLARLNKSKIFKAGIGGLKIGGIIYGFDKLYLYYFRDYAFNQKNLDKRTENELRLMVNTLLKNEDAVNEYMLHTATKELTKITEQGGADNIFQLDITETPEEFFDEAMTQLKKENSVKSPSKIEKEKTVTAKTPSIEEVLSEKINPLTNKPYVFKIGQKGDSISEIQKMLSTIDEKYSNILKKGLDKNKNGIDGIFGKNTFDAVKQFQTDNSLEKVDGIVGYETLIELKDLSAIEKEEPFISTPPPEV